MAFAKIEISPIYDGEFNMDSSACWIENTKQEILVYGQDSSFVKIKYNGEIISINNLAKNHFKCGNNLQFSSKDKSLTLNIKLGKSKNEQCLADISLKAKKERKILKQLKFKCS